MRRGRPPARRSAKRIEADKVFAIARDQRRKLAGGWCEGSTPACRPGPHQGAHAHHVRRRSQGGAHEVENLRWLCWDAHDWVHSEIAAARELGLLA